MADGEVEEQDFGEGSLPDVPLFPSFADADKLDPFVDGMRSVPSFGDDGVQVEGIEQAVGEVFGMRCVPSFGVDGVAIEGVEQIEPYPKPEQAGALLVPPGGTERAPEQIGRKDHGPNPMDESAEDTEDMESRWLKLVMSNRGLYEKELQARVQRGQARRLQNDAVTQVFQPQEENEVGRRTAPYHGLQECEVAKLGLGADPNDGFDAGGKEMDLGMELPSFGLGEAIDLVKHPVPDFDQELADQVIRKAMGEASIEQRAELVRLAAAARGRSKEVEIGSIDSGCAGA